VTAYGEWLVPADINRIEAALVFDVRRQSASGLATIHFHTAEDGWALFDLRQQVQSARLNGKPISTEAVAPIRLGAKVEQSMRAVRHKSRAGEPSALRLDYPVSLPNASSMGRYRPAILWRDGGVHFNFGFTDLGGGRYLEAWVPANLIFDEYRFTLDLSVRGSRAKHVLITNGEARQTDGNRWHVDFPPRFTALSPMVQLHPAATMESASRVTAEGVTIDAHKFRTDPVNLAHQLDTIAACLRRNSEEIGPYHHGRRYTAFLHIGGMEYDGACTSSSDALEHEVFHSWWARGLKPASQNDGWIDEALAVYFDNGGDTALPFDFDEPPVVLCSSNRWNRATPLAAYREGYRFIQGLAAHIGVSDLRKLLSDFYRAHAPGLVTTAQLERHILCHTHGDERIARAFSRFVYGRH
jgi:hypothetical protein